MRLGRGTLAALVCFAALAAGTPSHAQITRYDPEGKLEWGLGLGTVFSPRPYPGHSTEVFPVPMFGVRYKNFYFEGVRSGFRWFPGERGEVDVFARIDFSGLDPDQSEFLEGMQERELTVMAGLKLAWMYEHVGLEWKVATDALGRSNGTESSLVVPFPTKPGRWRLTPGVGLQWQSSNYVGYYYGVRPDEARPGRPAYEGGDAWNALVNVRATRAFGQERKWILIAGVEFTWLGDEIRQSPIVEDSTTTGGFLGFWYRF